MKTKLTLQMNQGTADAAGNAKRVGGWSESVYSSLALDDPALRLDAINLANRRAALLPKSGTIFNVRAQQVEPVGPSVPFGITRPGVASRDQDLPSQSLLFRMRSSAGLNSRNFFIRGVPDAMIVTGEYKPDAAYTAAVSAYFALIAESFEMKGEVRDLPTIKVGTVTAEGLMTTLGAHGLSVGDEFKFLRTRDNDNNLLEDVFAVATVPTASTLTVFNWVNVWGVAISKGSIRAWAEDYFDLQINADELRTARAVDHKVGAPFGNFHGRQSAKR